MISSIEFKNFKLLRDTTLPLGPFTLIVGPNGSGKSSAFQALMSFRQGYVDLLRAIPIGIEWNQDSKGIVCINWQRQVGGIKTILMYRGNTVFEQLFVDDNGNNADVDSVQRVKNICSSTRIFSLDAGACAADVNLIPKLELGPSGQNLAGVLDRLRDEAPERFENLNSELGRWFPEYDRVLFATPKEGHRSIMLRMSEGGASIPARDVSQGQLIALALLTLAYLPEPPPVIGLEEPDRGIHPRLLRDVRDAIYRLCHPEAYGETRKPVQVIATTHSPYFLELFKDHPEEIVIAHRVGQEAKFERLIDRPDIDEILKDAPLGAVWYSGVLGGVPANS